MKSCLSKINRILEHSILSIGNILLVLTVLFIFIEVITRYILGISHSMLEELSKWFQNWIALLFLGLIEKERKHISVESLTIRLPEKYLVLCLLIADIATLSFAIILCWSGIKLTQFLISADILSSTEIPIYTWIIRLCVPLGALLLSFFSFQHLTNDIISIGKWGATKR